MLYFFSPSPQNFIITQDDYTILKCDFCILLPKVVILWPSAEDIIFVMGGGAIGGLLVLISNLYFFFKLNA